MKPTLLLLALALCGCDNRDEIDLARESCTQIYNARMAKRVEAGEPPPVVTSPIQQPETEIVVGTKVKVLGIPGHGVVGVVGAFSYDIIFVSTNGSVSMLNKVPTSLLEKIP